MVHGTCGLVSDWPGLTYSQVKRTASMSMSMPMPMSMSMPMPMPMPMYGCTQLADLISLISVPRQLMHRKLPSPFPVTTAVLTPQAACAPRARHQKFCTPPSATSAIDIIGRKRLFLCRARPFLPPPYPKIPRFAFSTSRYPDSLAKMSEITHPTIQGS